MPMIEGTTSQKTATAEYDFARHGGAISTITLSGAGADGNDVPPGAIITGGFIEVDTPLTSGGAATVAVTVEGAGDLQTAAVVSGAPWSTTGRKAITPVGAATSVKTTTRRSVTASVAAAALTAGKFRVVLFYR